MTVYCVFFNDTATTEIYTLSLHDALPIYTVRPPLGTYLGVAGDPEVTELVESSDTLLLGVIPSDTNLAASRTRLDQQGRSEEHTSELQSRQYLVCRLLLEKQNTIIHSLHI